MKKIMVLAAAVTAGVSLADTQTVNGVVWHYTVEGRGAILNSGVRDEWRDAEDGVCIDTSTSGDLEIPSRLGGKPVMAVGDHAFMDCSKITSVKVPASVECIGDEVFFGCTSLTNINLSEGLESFGDQAFFGCPRVKSIVLPNSVKLRHIDDDRWNCLSICTTAELRFKPENVRYVVRNGAIYDREMTTLLTYCGNDRRVVVEAGVKSIGVGVFRKSSVEEVILPESLEIIEDNAFAGCDNMVSVEIPANVVRIESDAFWGSDNLCAVFYRGRKVDMADDSFSGCGRIVSFVRKDHGWENEDGVLAGCRKRKGDAYVNDYWNPQETASEADRLELVRRHLAEWAAKRDAKACGVLAKLYKDGRLKPSGDECEMKYLRLGCDANAERGEYKDRKGWFLCQIGECYRTGRGVPVDYAEAMKWYEKAQRQRRGDWGSILSQGLSEMFEKGQGVEKSPSAAFWTAALASSLRGWGTSGIYERCGDLYRDGIGVAADRTRADKMYWMALRCRNLDTETAARLRKKLGID